MPKLLNGKRLDFNPNAIVQANKILSSRINENMKNALKDTDFKTLSNIDAERRLSDNMTILKEMMGDFRNILMRIKTYFATAISKGEFESDDPFGVDIDDIALDEFSMIGSSRKYKKKGGARANLNDELNDLRRRRDTYMIGGSETGSEYSRYSNNFNPSDMDFEAHSTRSSRYDDDGLGFVPRRERFSDVPPIFSPVRDRPGLLKVDATSGSISLALFYRLIQLTRKIDLFIVSRIKPAINSLKQEDIQTLIELFNMVKNSYDDIVMPLGSQVKRGKKSMNVSLENFIANKVEYGDEMLDIFNRERNKLLTDLTVFINSWKQNTPTGEQMQIGQDLQKDFQNISKYLGEDITGYITPSRLAVSQSVDSSNPDGSGRKMKAGGRNFYGEVIDKGVRDIPTIYGHLRNCPTKYLL